MTSLAAALASKIYDVDDFAAAQELYHGNGWTDGLPIVPPTESAVEACLEWAMMPPDQLIGIEPVREQPITAEKLAINAVMAGCLPMHFPVVVTAWTAMLQDEFLLHGATVSTGGCAVLVIINGPIRLETRRQRHLQRARQQRPRHRRDRPRHPARPDQHHGRAARRHRPLDARPPRQVLLLPRRGRGRHDLAAAGGARAACRRRHLGRHRYGRDGAAPDHERVDHRPEEILETFAAEMRANLRHYSIYGGNYAIVIPKQLREHIQARRLDQERHRRVHLRARPHPPRANGPMSARARWCATAARASTRRWNRRTICWSSRPAARPGGFGAVIPPWMGHKTKAVTAAIGACVDCEPPKNA